MSVYMAQAVVYKGLEFVGYRDYMIFVFYVS